MLRTDKEKAICAEYSAWDDAGYVHCNECPNRIFLNGFPEVGVCRATYHYDRHLCQWVPDEEGEE